MNEMWENNKKKIIIAGSLLLIAIVFSVFTSLMNKNRINPEKALEELGTLYYEELYYPYLSENHKDVYVNVLEIKGKEGIKVSLLDLLVKIENASLSIFINGDTTYDLNNSYVIFYPKNPYEIEDYEMTINLVEATYESGDDNE